MASDTGDKGVRIERLRSIVNEDYARISKTDDPFVVLNLAPGSRWDEAAARYERYERFYRAENFQRLGDMDLTRKALDVRRAVGRSIVEIQGMLEGNENVFEEPTALTELDPNSRALGDIYYRDGLTYLRLGDVDSAIDCLRRASEYDPTRGIILAYLAYTTFRRRMKSPDVVKESERSMAQAVRMEPDNPDVHVLAARFWLKLREVDKAFDHIRTVEKLEPDHPKLKSLYRRLERARS
jgi:tetratricopeptide (TPR) repeat protein